MKLYEVILNVQVDDDDTDIADANGAMDAMVERVEAAVCPHNKPTHEWHDADCVQFVMSGRWVRDPLEDHEELKGVGREIVRAARAVLDDAAVWRDVDPELAQPIADAVVLALRPWLKGPPELQW